MNKPHTVTLRSGQAMPSIGFGTWQLSGNVEEKVATAFKLGYRHVDTSGDYGTQIGVGEGIKLSGLPREEIFVTTKIENHEDAYEATLKNLGELKLDDVDLMLIHWPPEHGAGEDLWRGLIRAKKEGLVKNIGVSNYSIDGILSLLEDSGEMPVVNQIEWSPFGYSKAMLDFAHDNDIVIQAYSPLTRGKKLQHPRLKDIAKKYNKTPAQLLLRWDIQHGVVPLPKAGSKIHLKENLNIFDFEISEADMRYLDKQNKLSSSTKKGLVST